MCGSSPRVRGKPRNVTIRAAQSRLIPARAGKTADDAMHEGGRTAHPRACGENSASFSLSLVSAGSSPRVRGKPSCTASTRTRSRLIPARAGKTGRHAANSETTAAHPRACGENAVNRHLISFSVGSSPRVRGKRTVLFLQLFSGRLIPARAGKTSSMHCSAYSGTAHPRACGENIGIIGPARVR